MTITGKIHFEGMSACEIFGITHEDMCARLVPKIIETHQEIVDNFKDYSTPADNEYTFKLHLGKVIERMLKISDNQQDQLAILVGAERMGALISRDIEKKSFLNAIKTLTND